MIHNFGQKPGMYGNLTSMMNSPLEAMSTSPSNFMGIGMMMEGINQNHIIYELTAEMAWHNESFDLNKWVENFVLSRYGNAYAMSAWNLMTDSSIQGVYVFFTFNLNLGDFVLLSFSHTPLHFNTHAHKQIHSKHEQRRRRFRVSDNT